MNAKLVGSVAAVVVVAAVAWWLLLWRPVGHKVSAARASETQAQATLTALRITLTELRLEETKVPAERRALHQLQLAVPASPELGPALSQLSGAAGATGAVISEISPTPPSGSATTPGAPVALPLSMSVSGSYGQLTGFVQRVESLPRLFVVSGLQFSTGGSKAPMQLSLQADMFYDPAAG
ncbi:MAG: type 4a pilus biogenesis protein PilO [Actinomycetota bacterium]|nr:type 4a pilus biogenesis protein PilO [Actinomycetota bacterium]